MTQYNITLDDESVRGLFMGDGQDVMRKLMEMTLNQFLESRAEDLCNAKPYEQTDDRTDYRNGSREKGFNTRLGTMELVVPRLRTQSVTEGFFDRYKRSEQALIAGIAEMVVKGVSTRKVKDVAMAMFGGNISKSQVSRICASLDPIVSEFMDRPLDEWYPFVMVDAMYLKVREMGRVISKALYIALGVNLNGNREVLGFAMSAAETKESYVEFFRSMKDRGLNRVDLAISDNHPGLREAIKQEFIGASWQRCQTHFSKNMLDKIPKKYWPEAREALRDIYNAPDVEVARKRSCEMVKWLSSIAPNAATLLDEAFDDITAVFALPSDYRKKLRTSNGIERLNEEIRRRDKVIRIYPSDDSILRIIGTILLEQDQKWQTERVYLNITEYLDHLDKVNRVCSDNEPGKEESSREAA